MADNGSEIDIVLPVFREERLFEEFYETAKRSIHRAWRLLVVYDDPTDSTLTVIVPLAAADPRIVPVRNPIRGVASAVKTGIAAATAKSVFVTAVDLPDDLLLLDRMFGMMEGSALAIVAPSRYMSGGSREDGALVNRTLSRLAGTSLRRLAGLPISDATNGSKLYRDSFLRSVRIESEGGWAIALELVAKAHRLGLGMAEVPTHHRRRRAGKSKFRLLAWLPEYLRWYLLATACRFRRHPRQDETVNHDPTL